MQAWQHIQGVSKYELITALTEMTEAEYKEFAGQILSLQHHHDTTVGLWVSDGGEQYQITASV